MNPNDQNTDFSNLFPLKNDKGTAGSSKDTEKPNPAADMIRQKLLSIYENAPKASKELEEVAKSSKPLSKHQQFIAELRNEGKSPNEIQTAWNEYYEGLSNKEKHEVWEEFYSANKLSPSHHHQTYTPAPTRDMTEDDEEEVKKSPKVIKERYIQPPSTPVRPRTASEVKKHLLKNVERHKDKAWFKSLHSLAVGLFIGFLVIFIFLFSFFNERFLAPFITPSRNVSAAALITNPNAPAGPNPIIIIPKINVELPVDYSLPTTDEANIENALEDGVVHYPTTPFPGQLGNGAIFGHSSNNILNPGQYKFAFVLLHDLVNGDTFTLNYQGKAYVYQVISKTIVSPNDTSVLDTIPNQPATFTLITCDPPGTSINRLIIVGKQISPDPSTDSASTIDQNTANKPTILPSNSPSLWSRILKALDI